MLVLADQGLPFWHQKYIKKSCFFKTPSCRPSFQVLCWFNEKTVDLGTPSKSSGRQNLTPNRPSGAKLSRNNISISRPWRVYFATCFSWGNNNCRGSVDVVVFQRSFFDGDWLIFCFFYFPVCYILYNMFITVFHNTRVNVRKLSPLIFEKFAPHFKQ